MNTPITPRNPLNEIYMIAQVIKIHVTSNLLLGTLAISRLASNSSAESFSAFTATSLSEIDKASNRDASSFRLAFGFRFVVDECGKIME